MAQTGEFLQVTRAFDKEAEKFRGLFKGQTPALSVESMTRKYPGAITLTTGINANPDGRYTGFIVNTTEWTTT